ncbi:hypothetical protein [Clostridium sp.]|uniref:hypothetical protein n=1 Tax=Clostridium sp. TaxID=1506 RepID=UPI003216EA0F
MISRKEKAVIDSKVGNVIDKMSLGKVTLHGEYISSDSGYADNLEISIISEQDGKEIIFPVYYSGYSLKLFLGDFNGDGKSEIMLRGSFGGSGGFEIASIYEYKDGKVEEIFSPDMFSEKYKFEAKYLNNYKVRVDAVTLNKKWIIDISSKPKIYLNFIYDDKGNVIDEGMSSVSPINSAYPINDVYQDYYNLFVRQRIIGISNADTIGVVESFVNLKDNNITINSVGVFTYGENIDNMTNMTRRMIENQDI